MKTMNYRISGWIMILLMISGISLHAQIRVEKIPDTTKAGNGLVFCLPQTRVLAEVIIEKTVSTRGELSEFTQEFLGTNDIIRESKIQYAIQDLIISTQAEPDVSQYYVLTKKNRFPWLSKESRVNLTRDGLLHSINWKSDECRFEQVMPSVRAFNWDHKAPGPETSTYFTYHLNTNLITPVKVSLPFTDTTVNPPEAKPLPDKNPPAEMSLRDKARESALELSRIRDAKEKLLSGYQEISYDPGTLKLMTEQLQKMEEHILQQFKGSQKTETLRYEYSCVPAVNQEEPIVLFRFSPTLGICDIQSGLGEAISLGFIKGKTTVGATPEIKGKRKGFGIPFRLPNTAECTIIQGTEEVFRSRITIAQFGEISRLPEKVKRVLFYPETGGIKSLLKD